MISMGNTGIILIVAGIIALGIVILFFVGDFFSKRNIAAKKNTAAVQKPVDVKEEPVGASAVPEVTVSASDDNTLATEIEALIMEGSSKREDRIESASQRSRMHNRRARMLEYYDKKYKSRTMIFDPNSFDEPVDNYSSSSSSLVVDGVEITKEDVRKLTALNDLLARKTLQE